MDAMIAMMNMTTTSSINVNARGRFDPAGACVIFVLVMSAI